MIISYIDRRTGEKKTEEVFGENAVRLLYGKSYLSKTFGRTILHSFAKWRPFSHFYGWLQKRPFSKKNIASFVKRFDIDVSEFSCPVDSFSSFNDFFIRTLKPESRPISSSPATIPADGRYRFYPEIRKADHFNVKKSTFNLEKVLQNRALADQYDGGTLIIARLCPTDLHRFYFPCDCTPSRAELINGRLYSVNPMAITDNPWIWGVNRRMLTKLQSPTFGQVLYMEVGATNVGSIVQTYTPDTAQTKGSEKGYFSFGGSALLIFFERNKLKLDPDLLGHDLEMLCLVGQSLGNAG